MRQLTTEALRALIKATGAPFVSLYQPTHRSSPDNQQDPIRYKNLVRDAEDSLLEKYQGREVRPLLEKFQALSNDYQFWAHQKLGLAVLGSADLFEVFQLYRPVEELVVVADSFHLKPLLRKVQSADRFQVLALDRHKAALYEGNRDALDEIDLGDMPATLTEALGGDLTEPHLTVASYGTGAGGPAMVHGHGGKDAEVDKDTDRFFRAIDREVLDRYSRPSGLPLVLVALPEHHAEFRKVSHNPFLQAEAVAKGPGALDADKLRAEVWKVVEPKYHERLAKLVEDQGAAASRGLGSFDLSDIAKAAVASRVGSLLIEANRELPGRFDPATGSVAPGRLGDPDVDDMIDDVAEAVLRAGGEVVVVPTDRMPSDTGVAATYRF